MQKFFNNYIVINKFRNCQIGIIMLVIIAYKILKKRYTIFFLRYNKLEKEKNLIN